MSYTRARLVLAVALTGFALNQAVALPGPAETETERALPADSTTSVEPTAPPLVVDEDPIEAEEAVCQDGETCSDAEACDDAPCDAGEEAAASDDTTEPDDQNAVYPTHHQTKVIPVNTEGLPQTSLTSFCLSPSGEILAACDGEVRVFSDDGDYLATWELPITPEAINIGSDGRVYIAGQSKLLRITAEGKMLSNVRSPLAASLLEQRDKIREEVIERTKRNTERYGEMREQYAEQVTELEARQAATEEAGEEAEEPFNAAHEQQLKMAQMMVEQMDRIIEQLGGAKEMTEEQIEQRVDATMEYKLRVASISEADGEVFLATSAPTGHGYAVWRMSRHFDSQKMIAKDLRGCCGQMDVQVNEHGVFVAENSRDRVCRFDREGKLVCEWGHSARSGLEGFGSCCNPMNVNFGPEGSVYTAESGSGRIKRYGADGELLELVGKVDLVPGCKKVAIAATPDGDRLYMLDITRNHIVMMQRLGEGETTDYFEVRSPPRRNPVTNPIGSLLQTFSRAIDSE